MSYIDNTLLPSETILVRSHPHWIIFSPTIIWAILTILFVIMGPNFEISTFTMAGSPPLYLMAACFSLFFAFITALSAYITYTTSEYGITNKRVLMKVGLIRRTSLEILLKKIESIKVDQTIPGRFFNYGSIIISGTGGSKDPFAYIPDPLLFRRKVQHQIEEQELMDEHQ